MELLYVVLAQHTDVAPAAVPMLHGATGLGDSCLLALAAVTTSYFTHPDMYWTLCQHWLSPWLHAVMLKLVLSTNSCYIPQGCLFSFLHPASNTLQSALQDGDGNRGEGVTVEPGSQSRPLETSGHELQSLWLKASDIWKLYDEINAATDTVREGDTQRERESPAYST